MARQGLTARSVEVLERVCPVARFEASVTQATVGHPCLTLMAEWSRALPLA